MIKYFKPEHTEKEKQIYVSTVGYEEIAPGEEYPSHKHPAGYYFDPSVGRVIGEYQIVYFVDGEGTLRLQDIFRKCAYASARHMAQLLS